jgi:hypothetical protein
MQGCKTAAVAAATTKAPKAISDQAIAYRAGRAHCLALAQAEELQVVQRGHLALQPSLSNGSSNAPAGEVKQAARQPQCSRTCSVGQEQHMCFTPLQCTGKEVAAVASQYHITCCQRIRLQMLPRYVVQI